MELDFNLTGIFPTPVYQSANIKKFTKEEIDFVKDNENKIYANDGNTTSLDTFVLDKPIFKELKKLLTNHINNYLLNIHFPKNKDLKLYITQSWLNYTKKNEWHHSHVHQNSFISGVLFIQADQKVDTIFFEKKHYDNNLLIESEKHIGVNSPFWSFEVDTGMLMLFPSTLIHAVRKKEDDNLRISLSFNTFIKGTLGNSERLNELKL